MRTGWVFGVVAGAGLAAAAGAEPVDGKSARAMLYSPKGTDVEVVPQPFLSDADLKIIETVAGQQKYYAAMAVSPDEGLVAEATVAAANYHDTEVAVSVALAGCDAARTGTTPCVVVALVRPKGWEPQVLQLSVDATEGMRKDYAGAKAPKGFARSAETGRWGMGQGEGAAEAALAACAAEAKTADCELVIAD